MDTLLHAVDRVTFQLSNRCPNAWAHANCPATLCADRPPENMAAGLVREVLWALGRHWYDGALAFHSFSEPLADPHLFFYIEHARQECPDCKIVLYTSGWNLDASLLHDLRMAGVHALNITAYSPAEHKRLAGLVEGIEEPQVRLKRCDWVPLFDQYEREPIQHTARCYAPLADLCITAGGWIGLCCRDWEHRHDLIDLAAVPFERAMLDERGVLRGLYERLATGERDLPICQRCDHARWWNNWRGPAPSPEELHA